MLIAGYGERFLHLTHDSKAELTFSLEADASGDGNWREWKTARVPAEGVVAVAVSEDVPGDWLRLKVNRASTVTAFFHLRTPRLPQCRLHDALRQPRARAAGGRVDRGLIRPRLLPRSAVSRASGRRGRRPRRRSTTKSTSSCDSPASTRLRRSLSSTRRLNPRPTTPSTRRRCSWSTSTASRWHLPKSPAAALDAAGMRGVREVVSERYLAHFDGTFYEIPRQGTKIGA